MEVDIQEKTTTVRLTSYLRILSVWSNKSREYFSLCKICFYDETGVIVSNGGYFDNDEELTFNGEVVKRNKENFTRKENFVMRTDNNTWDNNYALYVYVKNVDFKYIGLRKHINSVYRVYTVNGIEVKKHLKNLDSKIWEYKDLLEKEKDKIQGYKLPLDKEEMKKICKNIIKYNDLLIKEKQFIEEYEPTEDDFIEK